MTSESKARLWRHIPDELRARSQWAVAGPNKSPLTINGGNAKVNDSTTWATFDQAATVACNRGLHIGYVLSADDPFTCIDLDWCDAESQARKGKPIDPSLWSTQFDVDRYCRIIRGFNTYTERSTNGKGLHLWVRGKIVGDGLHQGGIEVYSQARFMVCTGDRLSHTNPNIEDRNAIVNAMVQDLRKNTTRVELVEVDAVTTDLKIIDTAINAENSAKYNDLCRGDWRKYGYPSQSEADLALLSIFAHYTKSNDQVRRLFRATALGKRDKATKNDSYINRTLRLIRGRQAEQASDNIAERMADQLLARLKAKLRGQIPPA